MLTQSFTPSSCHLVIVARDAGGAERATVLFAGHVDDSDAFSRMEFLSRLKTSRLLFSSRKSEGSFCDERSNETDKEISEIDGCAEPPRAL